MMNSCDDTSAISNNFINSVICYQLLQSNNRWKKVAQGIYWPDQTVCNAQKLTLSTKGKKYCVDGLKLNESCKKCVDQKHFIGKSARKNKLCQITTPDVNNKSTLITNTTQNRSNYVTTEPELDSCVRYPKNVQMRAEDSLLTNPTSDKVNKSIIHSQVRNEYPFKTNMKNGRQIKGNQKKTVTIKTSLNDGCYPLSNVRTNTGCCRFSCGQASYLSSQHNGEELKYHEQTSPSSSRRTSDSAAIEHGPSNCEETSSFSSNLSGKYKPALVGDELVEKDNSLIKDFNPLPGYDKETFTRESIGELKVNTAIGTDTDINHKVNDRYRDIFKACVGDKVEGGSKECKQQVKENHAERGECTTDFKPDIDVKGEKHLIENHNLINVTTGCGTDDIFNIMIKLLVNKNNISENSDSIKDVKIDKDVQEHKDVIDIQINQNCIRECTRNEAKEIFKNINKVIFNKNSICDSSEDIKTVQICNDITSNKVFQKDKDLEVLKKNNSSVFEYAKYKILKIIDELESQHQICDDEEENHGSNVNKYKTDVVSKLNEHYQELKDVKIYKSNIFQRIKNKTCKLLKNNKLVGKKSVKKHTCVCWHDLNGADVMSEMTEKTSVSCVTDPLPEFIYEEFSDGDWLAPKQVASYRSDLSQTSSGFKYCKVPKKKKTEPVQSIDDTIRYYAIQHPDILYNILEPILNVSEDTLNNKKYKNRERLDDSDMLPRETTSNLIKWKDCSCKATHKRINICKGISFKYNPKNVKHSTKI